MKDYIIGIILGIVISSLIFLPFLVLEQENKLALGKERGAINGQWQAIEALKPYLPTIPSNKEVKVLFSVKTTDIVIYQFNGENIIGIRE